MEGERGKTRGKEQDTGDRERRELGTVGGDRGT